MSQSESNDAAQACSNVEDEKVSFASFDEFYPYYLGQHANTTCRRLHIVGTTVGIFTMAGLLASPLWYLFPVAYPIALVFAWLGHFGFEKNKPAAFTNPIWSFRGDLKMFWETLTGQRPF